MSQSTDNNARNAVLSSSSAPTSASGGSLPAKVQVSVLRPAVMVPLGIGGVGLALAVFTTHWLLGFLGMVVGFGGLGLLLLTRALAQKSLEITDAAGGQSGAQDQERLQALSKRLAQLTYQASTKSLAEQSVGQLDSLKQRWKSLEAILNEKFDPNEVTYDRYKSTAASVRLAIVKNLEMVGQLLLGGGSAAGGSDAGELPVEEKVREILGFNATALVELERVAVALAQIQTHREGLGPIEQYLEDLRKLAARASKYDSSTPVLTKEDK